MLVHCFCCAAACGVGEDCYAKVGEGCRESFLDVERFDGVVDCCFFGVSGAVAENQGTYLFRSFP